MSILGTAKQNSVRFQSERQSNAYAIKISKHTIMKAISILFILLVSCSFLSCSSSKSTSNAAAINQVVMSDMKFAPETITVPVGSSVTWHNIDSKTHTATANDGSWDTDDMGFGASHSIIFSTAGTYKYHCKYHTILGIGMTGTVIVQ
jgi:plastocyanin